MDSTGGRRDREHLVEHEYDTADRDLERVGITISRSPSEAGVVWRLTLPRGERVEAWESGVNGLAPPAEVLRLIVGILGGKPLVPAPPVPTDPGARRLRELLEEQRRVLVAHDPGARLAEDGENLRAQRAAARRAAAYLRVVRAHVDASWRRELETPLARLAARTKQARDLDVLLADLRGELRALPAADERGAAALVTRLTRARAEAQATLVAALDDDELGDALDRLRLPPRLRRDGAAVPIDWLARKELRRVVRVLARLGGRHDDAALRLVELAVERARHAADMAPGTTVRPRRFLDDVRALQHVLVEHRRARSAEELLRSESVTDTPTAAAFAAGRVAERQAARRSRASARLPELWQRVRRSVKRLD